MQPERLSKRALIASLPPLSPGARTAYAIPGRAPAFGLDWLDGSERDQLESAARDSGTGSVLFADGSRAMLVLPPFPVTEAATFDGIELAPLEAILDRPRAYAVLLLRRGGYTTGFFRGDFLVASKTGRRFVKNRHRAGGQSQGRYDRTRDKQIHELLQKTCEDARATLTPFEKEIEHVFFGGDWLLLIELHKACDYFDRFRERMSNRTIPISGDPRRASLDAVPREVWMSVVYRAERTAD